MIATYTIVICDGCGFNFARRCKGEPSDPGCFHFDDRPCDTCGSDLHLVEPWLLYNRRSDARRVANRLDGVE